MALNEPKMPDASAWTGSLDEALERLRFLATPQKTGRPCVDARDRYAIARILADVRFMREIALSGSEDRNKVAAIERILR